MLFEDDRYLAVSKPPGLLVHRTAIDAHERENLRDILRDHCPGRIDPVHRLDKPTSGVIVFGKDVEAIHACKVQFESRDTLKEYLCVVRGHIEGEGCIGKPLPKGMEGPPRTARTGFSPLLRCELPYPVSRYETARLTLVRCTPQTGRYHQIRLHMRHFRHPIIGDSQHGDKPQNRAFASFTGVGGLLLHAHRFAFNHPDGGRVELESALPDHWKGMENATQWPLSRYGTDSGRRSDTGMHA